MTFYLATFCIILCYKLLTRTYSSRFLTCIVACLVRSMYYLQWWYKSSCSEYLQYILFNCRSRWITCK